MLLGEQKQVKALNSEHLPQLQRFISLIQEQQHAVQDLLRQLANEEKTVNALSSITYDDVHQQSVMQSARNFYYRTCHELREEIHVHQQTATLFQEELERFLERTYQLKARDVWHLDLEQRVIYRVPQGPERLQQEEVEILSSADETI